MPDVDIYDLNSKSKKKWILFAGGCIAFLTPFTDTVYLPALNAISSYFNTSDNAVAATVSAYMACLGFGQLIWGPLSDKFGRQKIMFGGLLIYEVFTIGCIFSISINMLIALRCIEGFIVGSSIVSVQAIIADIFSPNERGAAMGAFLSPMLLGPIVAPLVGGAITDIFGWQSCFVLLACMGAVITLLAKAIVPETHHYILAQRNIKERKRLAEIENNTSRASLVDVLRKSLFGERQIPTIIGAESVPRPELMKPWEPLQFLFDSQLAPYYAAVGSTFACMFTSLTVLPLQLGDSPYNLTATIIGVTYLPVGIAQLLGALIGGPLSDFSANKYSKTPHGRMYYTIPWLWLVPVGGIGFGLSLQHGLSLGYVLVSQSFIGLGQAILMPSTLGYLSSVRPNNAASVGSVLLFTCFIGASICIGISVSIIDSIGIGNFYLILVLFTSLCASWSTCITICEVTKNKIPIDNTNSQSSSTVGVEVARTSLNVNSPFFHKDISCF